MHGPILSCFCLQNMFVLCLISGGELRRWYDSMRTRFGRLTMIKSGQEAKEHTKRDAWILNVFSFLSRHIVRVPSKQGHRVSNNTQILGCIQIFICEQ